MSHLFAWVDKVSERETSQRRTSYVPSPVVVWWSAQRSVRLHPQRLWNPCLGTQQVGGESGSLALRGG